MAPGEYSVAALPALRLRGSRAKNLLHPPGSHRQLSVSFGRLFAASTTVSRLNISPPYSFGKRYSHDDHRYSRWGANPGSVRIGEGKVPIASSGGGLGVLAGDPTTNKLRD